ncbi:acyl-CoA carboxylase subunit epsilon [Nocardioides zeae]|uniref:Acyl-CoA carboxylase subunit epsilon n=1 Tax=Nocardioides zeae TaxID=1457234 RepID=A0A6P0HE66_9ACTN|nr:acyl-CoA carboxylase subunit epsilon [Nocardioides zeae]
MTGDGTAGEPAEQAEVAPARPLLRVVNGDATPEEVAAVVAVLAALGGGAPAPAPRRTPEWSAPRRALRGPHHAAPGAWRASGLPR